MIISSMTQRSSRQRFPIVVGESRVFNQDVHGGGQSLKRLALAIEDGLK